MAWLDKTEAFLKRSWKWFVGLGVSFFAIYLVYKFRSQANTLKRLRREKAELAEKIKDLALAAEMEEDLNTAQDLMEEAEAKYNQLEELSRKVEDLEESIRERKKEIDRATLWSELEDIAGK